jgi:hypothetical protein
MHIESHLTSWLNPFIQKCWSVLGQLLGESVEERLERLDPLARLLALLDEVAVLLDEVCRCRDKLVLEGLHRLGDRLDGAVHVGRHLVDRALIVGSGARDDRVRVRRRILRARHELRKARRSVSVKERHPVKRERVRVVHLDDLGPLVVARVDEQLGYLAVF